jgi:hypothetical protein
MGTLTNIHGLPQSIVDAVTNDPYVGGGDISTTKLIDSPRVRVLGGKHKDQITVDVSERVWALLGQAVHTILERAGLRQEGVITEERLYADVDGWQVSGQVDTLHLASQKLSDFKVTTVWKKGGSDSWTRQLNVLRWLAHKNGHTINTLEVIGIFRDFRKSEALRDPSYPQAAIQTIPVPLWSLEETEDYVRERVAIHRAASNGIDIQCTDEERWMSPSKFALMKDGAKRAVRVADHAEDLGEVMEGYTIIERKGEAKRCAMYCDVAAFCTQWAKEKP